MRSVPMSSASAQLRRFLPFILTLGIGSVLAFYLMNREWSQMQWEIPGTRAEYPLAQSLRPWLISIGCFLPAVGALIYAFIDIMDRYITRMFLSSFLLCTGILSLIFILGDFAENVGEFGEFDDPILSTVHFYLLQMPMILNLVLPYTLLLGVLWALSKLSGSSEITGMLQSGRSLLRITAPIIVGSCFVAAYFGIFGFHWAPNSTLYRKLLFASISDSRNMENNPFAKACRYKNEVAGRIWNIRIPPEIDSPGAPLIDVHIEQFSAPGVLNYEIFADSASWNHATRVWTFKNAVYRKHNETPKNLEIVPEFEKKIHPTLVTEFPETPWQLISPSFRVDTQGTPTIKSIIDNRSVNPKMSRALHTEWHVRIAKIFSCILLGIIAIPSAITFQRRSPMAGIGIAIFLAAAMLFLYEFFPTLASAGYFPSWLGAWLPNIIYAIIAVYLFKKRLAMRSFQEWFAQFKAERAASRNPHIPS